MSSKSILLVDDAVFIRNFVIIALKTAGITNVKEAPDGQQAWAILQNHHADGKAFDLIISDWHMPNMDGLELLKHVRGSKAFQSTPFLMLTSDVSADNVRSAVKAGVSDYLAKPFRHDPLIQKVQHLLQEGHKNLFKTA